METESQIEGQMKNQIRHLQEDDIDAVAKIWLDTNVEVHSFIPSEYWKGNLTSVKGMFLQAEMYVYEENREILGFIGLDQSYIAGIFVKKQNRSLGIGKALLDFVKEQNLQVVGAHYELVYSGVFPAEKTAGAGGGGHSGHESDRACDSDLFPAGGRQGSGA